MIKSITVINPKNEQLVLELDKPEKSGLIVERVEGLGPGTATINATELATTDGSIYSSARLPSRNIVFSFLMTTAPNIGIDTIEQSRYLTYKYFPIKKKIKLVVSTDLRTAEIEGYVESNEPDIFNEKENTQVSIICTDPYFYMPGESDKAFSGVEALFEFPFWDDSLGTEHRTEIPGEEIDRTLKPGEFKTHVEWLSGGALGVSGVLTEYVVFTLYPFQNNAFDTSSEVYGGTIGFYYYVPSVGTAGKDYIFLLKFSKSTETDLLYTFESMTGNKITFIFNGDYQLPDGKTFGSNQSFRICISFNLLADLLGVPKTGTEKEDVMLEALNEGRLRMTVSADSTMVSDHLESVPAKETTPPTYEITYDPLPPTIEFGAIRLDTRANLKYHGDADTGVTITIHALADATGITIYNLGTREQFKINTDKIATITGKAFDAGDDIIINTVRGQRSVKLLRDGVYTNIISAIDRQHMAWFQVSEGDNIFAFTAETGEGNITVTFSYRSAYGGV